MTAALRHTLDALRITVGFLAVAAMLWLLLALPEFIAPDRVSSAAVVVRGAP